MGRAMGAKRALLSVYDKRGIVDFARDLVGLGWEVISTGGTLAALRAAGVPGTAVADVTGFPEILDGRVKTLHPAIHGGLLFRRDRLAERAEVDRHGIAPIDLVAANLYPFEETVANREVTLAEAVEQIDIGGPAMIRAAAKNFAGVVIVTDPAQYGPVLAELGRGTLDAERRRALAATAFAHVATYDAIVAAYLRSGSEAAAFPDELMVVGRKARDLRYGENPHQRAAAYRRSTAGGGEPGLLDAVQVAGKELSFNNLLDADAAWHVIAGLAEPAVAIVKHTIPCGLAARSTLEAAFVEALAGDPVSAFGGIVAVNRPLDGPTAQRLGALFFEVVVAPSFDETAREELSGKRNLRLLEMPNGTGLSDNRPPWDLRLIDGGLLVQDADAAADDPDTWRVATRRAPTLAETADLRFAWWAVRRVTSNAIVLVRDSALVGVGGGQPNRLESVRIAVGKAGPRGAGACLASDAFFPFRDGIDAAAAAGVTAVVQPGGSVRDDETVAAADEAGIAMLFTGVRHFRH